MRQLALRPLQHAHVDVVPDILNIVLIEPIAREKSHERGFVDQDLATEPVLECFLHLATIPYSAGNLCSRRALSARIMRA